MDESLGIRTLERQVIEAALVTTRPTSSAQERSEASSSLERWTAGTSGGSGAAIDTACWEAYINIIRISFGTGSDSTPSSNASTPNQSQHSNCSESSSRIVEQIAYVTSPSKNQPPSTYLEKQIQKEANGAKLLLTTLLCNKIRREYSRLVREQFQLARQVFETLANAILCLGNNLDNQGQDAKALVGGLCSALAAVTVRNEGIMSIINSCKCSIATSLGITANVPVDNMPIFSPSVALRLLADIPGEFQSHHDITKPVIQQSIQSTSNAVIEILQVSLNGYINGDGSSQQQDELLCQTLNALIKWSETFKMIALTQLNSGSPSLLSQLVALLSSASQQRQSFSEWYAKEVVIKAADALSTCIESTSDYGTQCRKQAVASLLASIPSPTEFLVAPLKISEAQEWEDATVSLSKLASTLAREDIEEIATCKLPGSSDLIQLLLSLQSHPIHEVAVPVLEVWLALQDLSTSERHPTLAAPLYQQLVEIILNRVSYPPTFVSWEEELDVESSDFNELRRLCTDVLVGAYYLLRSAYLETLANIVMAIDTQDWEVVESALWCMCAVGREASARVKSVKNAVSNGRESPVSSDGEATGVGLTQMLPYICAGGASSIPKRHPFVLSGIATFIGSYSTVWASSCPPSTIIEILAYLSAAISIPAATEASCKSIRLVLIASATKLAKAAAASPGADLSVALTQCMESSLSTNNAKAMFNVAEGCSRVSIQIRDKTQSRATLSAVTSPTISRAQSAFNIIITSSAEQEGSGQAASQLDAATKALTSYLGVLREIIRFCDSSSKLRAGESHVLTDVLTSAWPVLNDVASNPTCRTNEAVLGGLLAVHSQLLSVVPALIGPYFKDLINFVVKSYEESFTPSALEYVSSAVETFDIEPSIGEAAGVDESGKEMMFSQLMSHISKCTFTYVTQTKRPNECPLVIKAFYEMIQRYLLFCPGALLQCPEFTSLFGLALACLSECKGEGQSTRATLIFLSQVIGFKHLRLSKDKMEKITQFASILDNLIALNGEAITKTCIGALTGGAPQILIPSYSECLFSIMLHIKSTAPEESNSLLFTWLNTAMNDRSIMANSQNMNQETINTVINILCSSATESQKPICKMALADFSNIAKGDATTDVLMSYSTAA